MMSDSNKTSNLKLDDKTDPIIELEKEAEEHFMRIEYRVSLPTKTCLEYDVCLCVIPSLRHEEDHHQDQQQQQQFVFQAYGKSSRQAKTKACLQALEKLSILPKKPGWKYTRNTDDESQRGFIPYERLEETFQRIIRKLKAKIMPEADDVLKYEHEVDDEALSTFIHEEMHLLCDEGYKPYLNQYLMHRTMALFRFPSSCYDLYLIDDGEKDNSRTPKDNVTTSETTNPLNIDNRVLEWIESSLKSAIDPKAILDTLTCDFKVQLVNHKKKSFYEDNNDGYEEQPQISDEHLFQQILHNNVSSTISRHSSDNTTRIKHKTHQKQVDKAVTRDFWICVEEGHVVDISFYLSAARNNLYFFNKNNQNSNKNILHVAACRGHLNLCKFIIERFPSPASNLMNRIVDRMGRLPVHGAVQHNQINIIKYFMSLQQRHEEMEFTDGTKSIIVGMVNLLDSHENSTLHIAARNGNFSKNLPSIITEEENNNSNSDKRESSAQVVDCIRVIYSQNQNITRQIIDGKKVRMRIKRKQKQMRLSSHSRINSDNDDDDKQSINNLVQNNDNTFVKTITKDGHDFLDIRRVAKVYNYFMHTKLSPSEVKVFYKKWCYEAACYLYNEYLLPDKKHLLCKMNIETIQYILDRYDPEPESGVWQKELTSHHDTQTEQYNNCINNEQEEVTMQQRKMKWIQTIPDPQQLQFILEKAWMCSFLNKKNKFGQTALHIACFENRYDSHIGIIEYLLQQKEDLDINSRDIYGKTAYDLLLPRSVTGGQQTNNTNSIESNKLKSILNQIITLMQWKENEKEGRKNDQSSSSISCYYEKHLPTEDDKHEAAVVLQSFYYQLRYKKSKTPFTPALKCRMHGCDLEFGYGGILRDAEIYYKEREHHELHTCLYRLVICDWIGCGKQVIYKNLISHQNRHVRDRGIRIFNKEGSYIFKVPKNQGQIGSRKQIKVQMWGAGGGGCSFSFHDGSERGGGSGGAFVEALLKVVPG